MCPLLVSKAAEDYHVPFVGEPHQRIPLVCYAVGERAVCFVGIVLCLPLLPAVMHPKHSSPEGAPCVCAPRC
jgi:hypothetical protein